MSASWSTLIDTDALAAHVADPAFVVVDVRHDLAKPDDFGDAVYAQSHIPGARFAHVDRDLSARKTGRNGRHPLPSPESAAALFGRLGCSIEIPSEAAFEATSASTATISAHFAYLNAICRWLVAHGVSEIAARRQVAASFAGLAPLLHGQAPDFSELARDHATRGGTNEQFLGVLEQARVFDAVDSGLNQVLARLTRR